MKMLFLMLLSFQALASAPVNLKALEGTWKLKQTLTGDAPEETVWLFKSEAFAFMNKATTLTFGPNSNNGQNVKFTLHQEEDRYFASTGPHSHDRHKIELEYGSIFSISELREESFDYELKILGQNELQVTVTEKCQGLIPCLFGGSSQKVFVLAR